MTRTIATPSAQRGASLIIGLVLLLVLSVLAISTMSSATFGLAMTGNAQYAENAFQMAETGLDLSLAGGGYLNGGNSAIPATVINDANGDQIGTFDAATSFQETTPPPPREGRANSYGSFEACHFQTVATGGSARNATSQHTQEFYVICPGGS